MSGNEELLVSVPLFEKLSGKTIDRLDRCMVERRFQAGAEIVTEGDAGIGFYLVKQGAAEVRVGPGRVATRVLGPGQCFGEMALLDGRSRSATIVALEETVCLVLPRWDFLAELRSNPEMGVELLESVSLRLRDAEARLGSTPAGE